LRVVAAPDPADLRLLALLAEVGRVAVHDLAARAGMDTREAAARLAGLAAAGLPLVVGVECDQAALRYRLAVVNWQQPAAVPGPAGPPGQPGQPGQHGQPGAPGQYGPSGQPSRYPPPPYRPQDDPGGHPSGSQPVHGAGPNTGSHTGPRTVQSGPVPGTSGPGPAGWPTGGHVDPAGGRVDPVGTWGPPQTAAWARGDQGTRETVRTVPAGRPDPGRRTGVVGDVLGGQGLEGERVSIQLIEVVDPADFLFTAAGYQLQPGERSVVVHTELTNRGTAPLAALPDQYLVLVTDDGATVSKAPVSLSSRPPHRIGVQPGETAGGHTVYVLPEATEVTAVRWGARPDDGDRALTWTLRD